MAVLTPRHKNPRNEERQREIESVDLYFYFSFNWYIYIYIFLFVYCIIASYSDHRLKFLISIAIKIIIQN